MEIAGIYRKTDSYIPTVLEAEEQKPFAREGFVDIPGTPDNRDRLRVVDENARFVKKEAKVKIVYVSRDHGSEAKSRSFPTFRSSRYRRPELVIVSIALIFLLLIIALICARSYFELSSEKIPEVDPVSTTKDGGLLNPTTTVVTTFYEKTTSTDDSIATRHLTRTTSATAINHVSSATLRTHGYGGEFVQSTTAPSISQMTTFSNDSLTLMSNIRVSATQKTITPTSYPFHFRGTTFTATQSSSMTSNGKFMAGADDKETSKSIITPHSIPIFFMDGPFTFKEAKAACYQEGGRLALRGDLKKAWNLGYNRCTFGWLRDMHVAMIMQQGHASMDCDKGGVGVRYQSVKEPMQRYSGAYCAKDDDEIDISHLKIGSDKNKTVNWWVTLDPADSFNLRHALMTVKSEDGEAAIYPLMQALKSVYTCCNAFRMSVTDEEHPKTYIDTKYSDSYLREAVSFYRREMAPAKIFTHVSARYNAMIKHGSATTNRSATIAALVSMAKNAGLDGLMFDYEPRTNYTREHAEIYRIFLDELSDAMHENNMTLGTVISAWGILQYYDIYARSKAEFLGSMGSTYYGHDVESNRKNVLDMVADIEPKRLEIGLGLMYSDAILKNPLRNYRWEEEKFRSFLSWSKQQGISRFHVYSGQWKAHRAAEPFFLQALADV